MGEENKNIIRFEMPSLYKSVYYQFPLRGLWGSGILLVYFVIYGVRAKYTFTYILTGPVVLFGIAILLCLFIVWKIRWARLASELTIDKGKKEFRSYIYDIKKEAIFTVDDIKEIGREIGKRSIMLKFFLNDGTCVSWIDDRAREQSLEEIIQSFGLSIKNMKLW